MNFLYLSVALALVGLLVGLYLTTSVIGPISWLDAKLVIVVCTATGFFVGKAIERIVKGDR